MERNAGQDKKCRKILPHYGKKWNFFCKLFLSLNPLSDYDKIYKNKVL